MAKMRVMVSGEGFGTSESVWEVEEELVKAYTVYYKTGLALLVVGASKAVAEAGSDPHQQALSVLSKAGKD